MPGDTSASCRTRPPPCARGLAPPPTTALHSSTIPHGHEQDTQHVLGASYHALLLQESHKASRETGPSLKRPYVSPLPASSASRRTCLTLSLLGPMGAHCLLSAHAHLLLWPRSTNLLPLVPFRKGSGSCGTLLSATRSTSRGCWGSRTLSWGTCCRTSTITRRKGLSFAASCS